MTQSIRRPCHRAKVSVGAGSYGRVLCKQVCVPWDVILCNKASIAFPRFCLYSASCLVLGNIGFTSIEYWMKKEDKKPLN